MMTRGRKFSNPTPCSCPKKLGELHSPPTDGLRGRMPARQSKLSNLFQPVLSHFFAQENRPKRLASVQLQTHGNLNRSSTEPGNWGGASLLQGNELTWVPGIREPERRQINNLMTDA
jgi:hypothetical protein